MGDQQMLSGVYAIDFKDLSVGEHHFDFVVDSSLFDSYEGCEVLGGDCRVAVAMERGEAMLTLDFEISGYVEVECDRCLEPCKVVVEYSAPLVVKFTDDEQLDEPSDGDIMWAPRASSTIDLTHYIYESIILSLPYQRVHAEGECNAEMTAKFRIVSGEEFDAIERASEESDNETMPAEELAKLQALKDQMIGK